MKMFKRTVVLLAVISLMIGCSGKSNAEGTGTVDLDKIRENYAAAQELTAELNVKEAELKQFIVDAQKQIQNAKTPLEKKNLEEKLGQQFDIKRMASSKDQAQKWALIENAVIKSIKDISTAKKFDLVLNKQVVIDGGTDITDEVLAKLNTQKAK